MAAEGGIFLDILARLQLGPLERALKDLKFILAKAAKEDSEAFSSAFSVKGASSKFSEMVEASAAANREILNGMLALQTAEANINRARAANFGKHAKEMVDAQTALNEAILNGQNLIDRGSRGSDRTGGRSEPPVVAGGVEDRGAHDRTPPDRGAKPEGRGEGRKGRSIYPLVDYRGDTFDYVNGGGEGEGGAFGRGVGEHLFAGHVERHIARGARATGHFIGLGSAIFGGGLLVAGTRQAIGTDRSMQAVLARHQDMTHTAAYGARQTQAIYQLSTQVPFNPAQLGSVYEDVENRGYTGQAAIDVLKSAAQLAEATHTDLRATADGLMTNVRDFGTQVQLMSGNVDTYKQGLAAMAQQAGQLVLAAGKLGVNPEELYKSLGSVEPTAMEVMSNLPGGGPQASAEVLSALGLLSRVGIGPEQGSHNVSRILMTLGGLKPGSGAYNLLAQLGVKPQDISDSMRNKGLFPTLQSIQGAINSKVIQSGPDQGKVLMGWRLNNPQIQELMQGSFSSMTPEEQAFISGDQSIQQGTATRFSLRKPLQKAGFNADEAQDIVNYAQWNAMLHSPSKYSRAGGMTAMDPGQVYQLLAGTGDIARTFAILASHSGEGMDIRKQLTDVGGEALGKGFADMMKNLPDKAKQLEANLDSISAQMAQHLLPSLVRYTDDINTFLDKHRFIAGHLLEILGGVAAVWAAFKLKIPQGIGAAFKLLKSGVTGAATSVKEINWGAIASGAEKFNTEASAAGDKLTKAADKASASITTAGEKIETGAAAAGTKIEESAGPSGVGGVFNRARGALSGAGPMLGNAGGMLATSMGLPDQVKGMPQGLTTGLNTAAALSWMAGPEVGAPVTLAVGAVEVAAQLANVNGVNVNYPGEGLFRDIPQTPQQKADNLGALLNANPRPGQPGFVGPLTPSERGPASPAGGAGNGLYKGLLVPSGKARGGIIGYGGGGTTDASSQPLFSIADKGVDSVLGMLPNGTPVGLRGGEGILTPDAVQRIGGPAAIDQLNNPWADPLKVGATFYGSFAKGVAKYSPFGKYLTATSQTVDSLVDEFDKSTQMHQTGGLRKGGKGSLYERMLGIAAGDGSWPLNDSGHPEGKSGIVNAVKQAYLASGFPLNQWHDLEYIINHESGWNPTARNPKSGAYGLGQFLGHQGDKYGAMGAYSGDPSQEASAMLAYIRDRYGDPAAAAAFWKGHNYYSKGGVVGFSGGGRIPMPQAGGQWHRVPYDPNRVVGSPTLGFPDDATDYVPGLEAWQALAIDPSSPYWTGGRSPFRPRYDGEGPGGGMFPGQGSIGNWQDYFHDRIGKANLGGRDPGMSNWWEPWGTGSGIYNAPGHNVAGRKPGWSIGAAHGGIIGFSGGGVAPWGKGRNGFNSAGLPPGDFDRDARGLYQPGWNYQKFLLNGPMGDNHYGASAYHDKPYVHLQDRDKWVGGGFERWPDGVGHQEWGESVAWPWGKIQHAAKGGIIGYGIGGAIPLSPATPQPGGPGGPPPPPPPTPARAAPPQPAPGNRVPNVGGKPQVPGKPMQGPHGQPTTPPKPKKAPEPKSFAEKGEKAVGKQFTPKGTKPGEYAQPGDHRNLKENPSRKGGTNNDSKGFGVGGGLLGAAEGAAEMAASAAANMGAPGSGQAASQAMNIGFQLANRAIGYAGQLVGIGISGLMETFLPNDSALGDPTNNIFGKMAEGIAGAHPSPKNHAGDSAMKLQPKQDLDAGAMAAKQMPGIHIENIHNHTGDHMETTKAMQKSMFAATMGGLPVGNSQGY